MATTPEGRVKKKIKEILKSYDIYFLMPATHGFGTSGDPDFILCLGGYFVSIEAKANCARHRAGEMHNGKRVKTGAPTTLQQLRMEEIRKAGGVTLVIDEENVVNFETFIHEIDYEIKYVDKWGEAVSLHYMICSTAERYDLYYEVSPDYE